jgi:hypothetical protein
MATMRPTPRNELLGLLSDYMAGGLAYMRDPQRTQQMQGLAGLLESTGIPKTTERLAYGEPLTNIGRANVPLLKPETADALMTVAPFAPKGMKMIRATEGMPVGMSIKDVGKGMVKEIPKKSSLLDMTRTPSEAEIKKMSREDLIDWLQNNDPNGQYMDPTPNPSISMYRTGKGYAVENADSGDVFEFKDFNEAQEEFNSMRFSNAEFQPMTLQEAQESAINYLREFAQPEEGAKVIPLKKPKAKLNTPQQAALDLAQQRAALPVDQGGLGLPANNTAMDRARAMGYPMGKGFDVSYETGHSPIAITNTLSKPTSPRKKAEIIKAELEQMGIPVVGETAGTGSTYLKIPGNPYDISPKYGGGQTVPIETLRFSTHSKKEFGKPTNRPDLDSYLADVFPKGGNSLEEARKAINDLIKQGGIRSRFAAFDPFRKDVATATAMGVALPDLLAAELPEEELNRNQSAGLLFP